jgi:hypothetical protein
MKKRQKWALAEETTLFPYNRCHYMKKKTETGTGRGNNFISTQSMPLYGKKDRNGNWQRKLFHFNAINFIIS